MKVRRGKGKGAGNGEGREKSGGSAVKGPRVDAAGGQEGEEAKGIEGAGVIIHDDD